MNRAILELAIIRSAARLRRPVAARTGHFLHGVTELTDDFDAENVGGWIELSREIRLAIGPTTAASEIGVMFESRAYARLHIPMHVSEPLELRPACTLKPLDDVTASVPAAVFQTQIEGLWRRVATVDPIDEAEANVFSRDSYPFYWSVNPLDPASPTIEHWYFSWAAVNEATLAHWLDRPSGTKNASAIDHAGPRCDEPIWYARGSIAHEIEGALVSGGLERALGEAFDRVRHAMVERECQWKSEAHTAHEARMARWARIEHEGDGDDRT